MVGCMHRPLGQGQPRAEEGPWEPILGPPGGLERNMFWRLSTCLSSELCVRSFRSSSDVTKKVLSDQISMSSSGSSGSEMEDLSGPDSACSIRLQVWSAGCQLVLVG